MTNVSEESYQGRYTEKHEEVAVKENADGFIVWRLSKSLVWVLCCLLLFAESQIGAQWSPPPVAQRFGPLAYDSEISGPVNSLITSSESRPTDLTLRFQFVQKSRPTDYAFLISTAVGFGRGLKISLDKYGNVYLSIGRPSDAVDDYQLLKLSDPLPLGTPHDLFVKVSTLSPSILVKFDGEEVEMHEARPNTNFLPEDLFLNISNLEIGGSSGNNFVGELSGAEVVFGTATTAFDGTALRILMVLLAMALVVYHLGRRHDSEFSSRTVQGDGSEPGQYD